MGSFVLDCSMTMAWCFQDEATPRTNSVRSSLTKNSAIVPTVWCLEVINVLLVAEQRKRMSKTDSITFLSFLKELPIEIETEHPSMSHENIMELGRKHALSSYDAAYLDLALRKTVPLATLDTKLQAIAKKLDVQVI